MTLAGGRTVHLADDLAGRFSVVLFHRGSWCPYCNAQIGAFQRALDGLTEVDAPVVALSVDDDAATRDLIARRGMRLPVGQSADAAAVADVTGVRQPRPAPSWSPHRNDSVRHRQNPAQQTGVPHGTATA